VRSSDSRLAMTPQFRADPNSPWAMIRGGVEDGVSGLWRRMFSIRLDYPPCQPVARGVVGGRYRDVFFAKQGNRRMGTATIEEMADRIAGLMQDRLGVGGKGLAEKLRRGGRLLPRKVHAEAEVLASAAAMARNPKLLVRMDQARLTQAYEACAKHLGGVNRWGRAKGTTLDVASSIAFRLLVVTGLLIWVLRLRGLI
jgi:hypothetical protein